MPPPQLPGDAPRLDVAHPFEVSLVPIAGHEDGIAFLHRGDSRLGEFAGIDIPLLSQHRLNDDIGTVAEGLWDDLVFLAAEEA